MSDVRPIPEGFSTLTPHMCIRDAAAAIDFYKTAFGAEEIMRMSAPGSDKIMHAELKIGDSMVMLCDECSETGQWKAPQSLNGTTVVLGLYVENVDKVFQKAIDAGATVSMPVTDMFWGDRYGKVRDPFGHEWGIATHTQDLTPEQIGKGAEQFFAQAGDCKQ